MDHCQADAWLRTEFGPEATSLGALYGLDGGTPVPVALAKLTGDALFGWVRGRFCAQQHGTALSYTFGTLPETPLSSVIPGFSVRPGDFDETDDRLSRPMSEAIVQFAKSGDPNGRRLPKWAPYASAESYLEYGDSIVQKQKLRPKYLDALDLIFSAKRAADSR